MAPVAGLTMPHHQCGLVRSGAAAALGRWVPGLTLPADHRWKGAVEESPTVDSSQLARHAPTHQRSTRDLLDGKAADQPTLATARNSPLGRGVMRGV
jgi:hypothetical protein